MTIGLVLKGLSTLDQYSILQRADVMFPDRCGRYYGGTLTDAEQQQLMEAIKRGNTTSS